MSRRWDSSVARKMILSGLLLAMILIRHTIGTYPTDYRSRWPGGAKQQHHQVIHQHLQVEQHPLSRHSHRHHHEHMHSNREMHIKSQLHSHFYRDRDYRAGRPATTTTTMRPVLRTPSTHTLSWKWSSTTADNLRLAKLTHIRHQGGNETSAGSTAFKNRLSNGESQQWSADNKQIYTESFRTKIKNNTSENTSNTKPPTLKREDRSSWSHYSHSVKQHLEDPHLRVANNHHTSLGKTPRNVNVDVDPSKISHEDRRVKSIADNKDDYDYYEDEDEESEDVTIENKVEETKTHQDMADDYNFDYLDDEPNQQNDDESQNSLKTDSLTDEKWNNYGTAELVEKSRRRYINEAAKAHIQRIKEEGRCRWPHPKIIPVTEASKRFVPHCTILHRCGDDTGCCDYDTKTCVAKKTTTVNLNFYVIPLGGSASVEVRSFVNHTECHCVDRCLLSTCADSGSVNIINYGGAVAATILSGNETCRCPTHFDIVQEEFARGRCRCDCYNNNQACNILKRGQDGFPSEDHQCITEEKCQIPMCQYGRYNTYSGRCPKVRLQKRTISPYDYR